MAQAKKKIHEADTYAAEQIAKAAAFRAIIVLGPHDRRTADGMTSYAEALEAAAQLNGMSKFGRSAIIYAISANGRKAWPVDPGLAALAGLI